MKKLLIVGAVLCGAIGISAGASAQSPAQETPPAAQGSSSPSPAANASGDVDPASLAAAHRLAHAVHLQQTLMNVMERTLSLILVPIAQAHSLNDAQKNQLQQAMLEEIHNNPDELVLIAEREYASRLSAADLNAIADFYESPAGRRFVAQVPQMQSDLAALGGRWGRDVLAPRVVRRIEEMQQQQPGSHS